VIQTWGVSVFERITTKEPERRAWSFAQLKQVLGTHHRREGWTSKSTVAAWSPATYKEGTTRGAANVGTVTALVFDFDDGTPISAAGAFRDWAHLGHTSWSHSEEAPKWRIVLPLEEPVPGEHWPRAWHLAINLWEEIKPEGAGMPDLHCKDPSRLYFLPAWRSGQARQAWTWNGPECRLLGLDWQAIPEAPKRRTVAQSRTRIAPAADLDRDLKRRLRHEPRFRELWCDRLGGSIVNGYARRILCPQCSRNSVWYVIDPAEKKGAQCNHDAPPPDGSCGWFGNLWEL